MSRCFVGLLIILFSTLIAACAIDSANKDNQVIFETTWAGGIDERIELQSSNENSIQIAHIGIPGMMDALKVEIFRDSDYRRVANGTPRAEISFDRIFRFQRHRGYMVTWQTYIPPDYKFDTKQSEVVAQIHQGRKSGYPTLALFFTENGSYGVRSRTDNSDDSVGKIFGNLEADRGRIVDWALRYYPDDSGTHAFTELSKNGVKVFEVSGVPNAYSGDDDSYFKIGVYKANWKKLASDVDVRTLYYGRVSVEILK